MLGAALAKGTPTLPSGVWRRWGDRFMTKEGRVIDPSQGGITHTEGMGYGMLLALAANDRASFARIWRWTQDHLYRRNDGLGAWMWMPGQPNAPDTTNATDGDLLIAWALLRGAQRWSNRVWLRDSQRIAQAIRTLLIRESRFGPVLLPGITGFEPPGELILNPSYWVYPALQEMDQTDPHPLWRELERSGLRLLEQAQFGRHALPPDWLTLKGQDMIPTIGDRPARFGYEALRIPLYASWAGHADHVALEGLAAFWRADAAPAWINLNNGETAPHPLDTGGRAIRDYFLEARRDGAGTRQASMNEKALEQEHGYYSHTLALLAWVAMRDHLT